MLAHLILLSIWLLLVGVGVDGKLFKLVVAVVVVQGVYFRHLSFLLLLVPL
jgi:hypothetical protein